MFTAVRTFFRTGPDAPRMSADASKIRSFYESKRLSVFVSILLGYALFYVARINFSVAKKSLLDAGVMNTAEMGLAGSALLLVYSAGRFTNGFLADHCNIRRFISTGLLVSAIINLILGFNTSVVVFILLWGLNGWFQSFGSAPCVVALSQWFGKAERGTRYGIWSSSHSIGEGFTFVATAFLVSTLGWRWGFLGPGILTCIAALILFRTLADRPQTYGLPPVYEYKNEPVPVAEKEAKTGKLQLEVLKHPGVWILACASACIYVARYGMSSWGPLYLREAKGYSAMSAGSVLAIYPITQIIGSVSSGYISDRVFASRRALPAVIFCALETLSVMALFAIPEGHPILDMAALAAFGFALGALLVYFGGLMAIDLVSRRAAGAAMGFVGLFSYVVAAIQDSASGFLLHHSKTVVDGVTTYHFRGVFTVWTSALVLSLVLALALLYSERIRGKSSS